MRTLSLIVCAVSLAASCGGSADPSSPTPTPVPTAGPPTQLSILGGDNQTTEPGKATPVRPAVIVKDANGRVVPNVSVSFTIDSGGGTIASPLATTGTDGVATAGEWTLGTGVGSNVLSASVGSLMPARFRAKAQFGQTRTLIDAIPIGVNGGSLVYRRAGDPLDGLTVDIPKAAYPAPVAWTITADSSITVPLPAGFVAASPVLIIGNGQGYADSAMTLTMPLQFADSEIVAPFYFDRATGLLEGIPLVARSSSTVTLATRHFSRDLMAMPSNAANATTNSIATLFRSNAPPAFGSVMIVWVKTPKEKLIGTFTSSFRAGVDNWEFENLGDYISPGGDCEGMSITEMFYHFYYKLGGAPQLYRRFDLTLENVLDNVQGIRFTGSVQEDIGASYANGKSQISRLVEQGVARGTRVDYLTSTWILLTLKLTGHPVLLALQSADKGHAVVAYAATSTGSHTDVAFADPNYPATGRTMSFESGVLTPVALSQSAGKPTDQFIKAYALAVTSEVPMSTVASRYNEFLQKKAGADRYPRQYRVEYWSGVTESWSTLASTLQTTDEQLILRHVCPDCRFKSRGTSPDVMNLTLWNAAGSTMEIPTVGFLNTPGTTSHYARLTAWGWDDPSTDGIVDAIPFTVMYQPFTLEYPDGTHQVGEVLTFTAQAGALATAGSTYTWTVNDGSAAVTGTSKTFTKTFTRAGPNEITVTLKDASGKVIARTGVSRNETGALTITPAPVRASPGKPVTITVAADAAVFANLPSVAVLNYQWEFDGPNANSEPIFNESSGPSLVQTFPTAGTYTVKVTASWGMVIWGRGTGVAEIKNYAPAWRITTFTLQSSTLPRSLQPYEVAAFATVNGFLDQVVARPSDGMIFLEDNVLFSEHAVYFQVAPPGTGANAIYYVPNSFYTMLARNPNDLFSRYLSTGTTTSGTIDGVGYTANAFGSSYIIELNSIQSQKVGSTMSGTMTVGRAFFDGTRTFNFVATLVTP